MAVHRFQQFVAGGFGGKIQFRIERIKLEYIVMDRSRGRARSEISWRAARRHDAGSVAGTIGQVAATEASRQSLCGSRNVESAPVERVGGGLVAGILHIV